MKREEKKKEREKKNEGARTQKKLGERPTKSGIKSKSILEKQFKPFPLNNN